MQIAELEQQVLTIVYQFKQQTNRSKALLRCDLDGRSKQQEMNYDQNTQNLARYSFCKLSYQRQQFQIWQSMSSYILSLIGLIVLYLIYKVFLSFFVQYLIAGYHLGFDKITFFYRPLSPYSTLHKESLRKYKHPMGYIFEEIKKNPQLKIIFLRIVGTTHLYACDPESIRKLSFDYVGNLNKRGLLIFSPQINHGLIFAQGQLWKKSRKLMGNLFHFDVLESRSMLMEEIIARKIKNIHEQKPDLFKLGCSIGGEIVLKSLFGEDYYLVDFDGLNPYQQINELMSDMLMASRGFLNIVRLALGVKATKDSTFLTLKQKKVLKRLITFKEKSKDYLRTEQEKYKKGESVTKFLKAYFDLDHADLQDAVQQLFLFLLAGEDTTGALITFCLLRLAQYPLFQQSIIKDVEKAGVHNSKQLNNFISEVNRHCAPVSNSISRKVVEPFKIDGFTYTSGTIVTLGYRGVMHNVKFWDNPSEFDPSRFNKPVEQPNAYTPFSNGPRNCIGQHMALMQVRLTIVRILERYTLEKDGDTSVTVNRGVVNVPSNLHSVKFNLKDNTE